MIQELGWSETEYRSIIANNRRKEFLSLFHKLEDKIDDVDFHNASSLPIKYYPYADRMELDKASITSLLETSAQPEIAKEIALDFLCLKLGNALYPRSTPDEIRNLCTIFQERIINGGIRNILGNSYLVQEILEDQTLMASAHFDKDVRPQAYTKKILEIIDQHKSLYTGEWATRLLGKVLTCERENVSHKLYFHKVFEPHIQSEMDQNPSPFVRKGFMDSFCRSRTGFYDIDSNDPVEAYLAVVYQIGLDFLVNPLSNLQTSLSERNFYAPPFFTLAPHQIDAINLLGKTKFGKKCLSYSGPMMLDEEMPTLFTLGKAVCNKKWYKYATKHSQLSYISMSVLNLENEYYHKPLTDPRYTALCHLFALPSQLSLKSKATLIFGSDDEQALEKIKHLIQFYRTGKNHTIVASVFLAHELKEYMPNHTTREILGLVDVIANQIEYNAEDKVIRLFQSNPELAVLILSEPSKDGAFPFKKLCITEKNVNVWLSEKNIKACEKSVINMRFGKKHIVSRLKLQKRIVEIIKDANAIRAHNWVNDLEKQLKDNLVPKPVVHQEISWRNTPFF